MSSFLTDSNYSSLKFKQFFMTKSRDVVLYGGAGSGKSYSVADKFALEIIKQDQKKGIPLKFMIVRKSGPSLKRTCCPIISSRFKHFGIRYNLNKQDMIADCGNKSQIYYVSTNNKEDYEKVKSITDIDFIWMEEANELSQQVYAEIIKLRLRGGKGKYSQRIFTFNPISRANWLFDYHFLNNYDESEKIRVNIDDNVFKDIEFQKELEKLKDQNMNLYRVYRLGEFGTLEGTIYDPYKIYTQVPNTSNIIYGLDFGFNHKTALVQENIYDGQFYEEQKIYQSGLTNSQLIALMDKLEIRKDCPIYADSAEPARIQEIRNAGYNIYPADKRVNDGLDFCMRQTIHVHCDSTDIMREHETYMWATDKDGKKIDTPVKFNDDLMDARRYAIYSHRRFLNENSFDIVSEDITDEWEE